MVMKVPAVLESRCQKPAIYTTIVSIYLLAMTFIMGSYFLNLFFMNYEWLISTNGGITTLFFVYIPVWSFFTLSVLGAVFLLLREKKARKISLVSMFFWSFLIAILILYMISLNEATPIQGIMNIPLVGIFSLYMGSNGVMYLFLHKGWNSIR